MGQGAQHAKCLLAATVLLAGCGAELTSPVTRFLSGDAAATPAVPEAERFERVMDVARAVGGVGRDLVALGVINALAGVLDVEHLVP